MVKRKAPGRENVQLPSIAAILNEHPPPPKRQKPDTISTLPKKTALADISNSPVPISWTAFSSSSSSSSTADPWVKPPAAPILAPLPAIALTTAPPRKKAAAPKPAKPVKKSKAQPLPDNVAAVRLPGEDSDGVPVYDTCDVIRRKITAALTSNSHTKASLLRAFAACTSEPGRAIPATSFQHFMAAKGRTGGSKSRLFYAAYVYFEKVRVAESKKKTKTRVEMEEAWGVKGMDYMNVGKPCFVGPGEDLQCDQYGREVILCADGSQIPMLGDFSVRPFS
ncbi:hypothetical protein Dda_0094 [Drechslerella dactyloides]|uniref:DUF7726 domain-containing protein n=1 Tax=Drechslerella dactyloides TaxID=74499 RepID=A0AAD6J538_DREDA|nr:hypothetical protein Dda_0094 [Drechslerella dactyloides]